MSMFDWQIHEAIRSGRLVVDPFNPTHIGPASLDLTLSNSFKVVEGHKIGGVIRMDKPIIYEDAIRERFILAPKRFVLASTVERIGLPPNMMGSVSGRSSIGRMGLFVENAGWVDPGFNGVITLELYNANDYPIELIAGRRVCQIVFTRGERGADRPYTGKYQGLTSFTTTGSLIHRDREVTRGIIEEH